MITDCFEPVNNTNSNWCIWQNNHPLYSFINRWCHVSNDFAMFESKETIQWSSIIYNPYANHGAGIFTYKTGWFWTRANVGIHIPAPWFASKGNWMLWHLPNRRLFSVAAGEPATRTKFGRNVPQEHWLFAYGICFSYFWEQKNGSTTVCPHKFTDYMPISNSLNDPIVIPTISNIFACMDNIKKQP